MDELVAHHGVRRALCAADLEEAHKAGQSATIGDVEGLDFLDGKLERLEEAHQRSLRHLQLVHYTPNDIGDFQTAPLCITGLPNSALRLSAPHQLGFACDVAHATDQMVKQSVKLATKPLLLSIPPSLARRPWARHRSPRDRSAPTTRGRSLRPAGRSGFGTSFRASISTSTASRRWPTSSVSITSASAPTNSMHGLRRGLHALAHLVGAMLHGGFTAEETSKIAGGNYLRIFRAAVG